MGYTHFDKVSGENGIYVGAKDSEVEVVDSSGNVSIGGSSVTATAAEINMAADNSANCAAVAATKTITAAESGSTFFFGHATEFVMTLPAPALGLRYKFICTAAPASADYTIVTASSANIMVGSGSLTTIDDTDDGFVGTACDTITFADGVAVAGDWVEVISDGTSWYVSGHAKTTAGIALSQAST